MDECRGGYVVTAPQLFYGKQVVSVTFLAFDSPTEAEKRTLSRMQRRRFQNMQEDEAEVKRESIDDALFRELTRREHTATGKYF